MRCPFYRLIKVEANVALFLLLAYCCVGCSSFRDIGSSNTQTIRNLESTVLKAPTSRELMIETQRLNTNEFDIKVTNVSKKKVFCYYTSSLNGSSVGFHYYPEKRNVRADKFEKYSDGPDSLPELSFIDVDKSVEFKFFALNAGEYRLNISYLIDEDAASIIMNKIPPDRTEAEAATVYKATKVITTSSMLITKNKSRF